MKKSRFRRFWAIILTIALVLGFTNPSNSEYKDYLEVKYRGSVSKKSGKTSNFLIFSIYSGKIYDRYYSTSHSMTYKFTHLGILSNFFVLDRSEKSSSKEIRVAEPKRYFR